MIIIVIFVVIAVGTIIITITIITSTPIPKVWNLYPLIEVYHGVGRVAQATAGLLDPHSSAAEERDTGHTTSI
jgi:hypothetical protein